MKTKPAVKTKLVRKFLVLYEEEAPSDLKVGDMLIVETANGDRFRTRLIEHPIKNK